MDYRDSEEERDEAYCSWPLYKFDLKSKDKEVETSLLEWIKTNYRKGKENSAVYARFDNNLAMFLGMGPALKSIVRSTTEGPIRRKSKYVRLKINRLKSLVEVLVSRYLANKTAYFVSPKQMDDYTKEAKAKLSKGVIETIQHERNFEHKKRTAVQNALVMGESYLHTFWNTRIGGPKNKETLKHPYGETSEKSVADNLVINNRMGDVDYEVLDGRFTVPQEADGFVNSEWVINATYLLPEKLKIQYPKLEDKIGVAAKPEEYFRAESADHRSTKGRAVLYRVWHRSCPEMPDGWYIEATDAVILQSGPFKDKVMVENQFFPIAQLVDYAIPGSSRGFAGSIMEPGNEIQLMVHNLWAIWLRNLAKFPPMRVWPAEVDKRVLEQGTANDIFLDQRTSVQPQFLYADPVSPSLIQAIQELDSKLMQLAQRSPALSGQGMNNTEIRSGDMLRIYQDEDQATMLPMNDRIAELLLEVAYTTLAIAASNYKEDDKRMVKMFGNKAKYVKRGFRIQDIKIPVDIVIKPGSAFANTQAGRIAQIESVLKMFPNVPGKKPILPDKKILDILDMQDSDEIYATTAVVDTAEEEIGQILENKEVSPPNAQLDLLEYYEAYIRAMQHPRIKDIVPNKGEFFEAMAAAEGDSKKLPKDAGFQLLRQVYETEMLIEDKRLVNEVLRNEIMVRLPFFPTIYEPYPELGFNPQALAAEPAVPLPMPTGEEEAEAPAPQPLPPVTNQLPQPQGMV